MKMIKISRSSKKPKEEMLQALSTGYRIPENSSRFSDYEILKTRRNMVRFEAEG